MEKLWHYLLTQAIFNRTLDESKLIDTDDTVRKVLLIKV